MITSYLSLMTPLRESLAVRVPARADAHAMTSELKPGLSWAKRGLISYCICVWIIVHEYISTICFKGHGARVRGCTSPLRPRRPLHNLYTGKKKKNQRNSHGDVTGRDVVVAEVQPTPGSLLICKQDYSQTGGQICMEIGPQVDLGPVGTDRTLHAIQMWVEHFLPPTCNVD